MSRLSKMNQDITQAPLQTQLMVWWPIVKLDAEGELTSEVTGGAWLMSERDGPDSWLEPEILNALGDHMGDEFAYAAAPTAWLYPPSAPSGP